MFGLVILFLTLLAAGGAAYLALQLPPDVLQQWKLLTGGILVGVLFGTVLYWQQMHALNRAAEEREAAVADASNRAASDATRQASDDVTKRYKQQVEALTKKIADLEAKFPNQDAKLSVVADPGASPNTAKQPASGSSIFWIQSDDNVGKGAANVQFRIYAPLNVPAFVAICDHPCRAVGGQAGAGSEGFPVIGSTDRDVAGFIFKKPKPMPAGTEGVIRIQSSDRGPVEVTAFRILRESEVPADLR